MSELTADADLLLVGDGPDLSGLTALAAELGVADRVQFLGRRSAEEVQTIMADGDVVVMPSRKEAFGIVALEAWASGTPLVATSLGGPRGFVSDGVDGILVNPEDTAALASAIDRVLSDPDLADRLARTASQTVKGYTWDRVVDDYVGIYDEIL